MSHSALQHSALQFLPSLSNLINFCLEAGLESTASNCISYSRVHRPVHRMDDPNASLSTDSPSEPNGEGVLAGVKQQINSMTGGASVTEIQQNITTATGETAKSLKETVVDNVVPAAGEALQSAQASITALAGKAATESEAQAEKKMGNSDHQIIDQMDDEEICDFLRHKHRSTVQPPSKN